MSNVQTKSHTSEWVWAVLSAVYLISPVDIIPDIPVVGWVDDFFIGATASLNLIEGYAGDASRSLASVVRLFKWLTIIFGIIAIVLVLLLGALIVKLFS